MRLGMEVDDITRVERVSDCEQSFAWRQCQHTQKGKSYQVDAYQSKPLGNGFKVGRTKSLEAYLGSVFRVAIAL